MNLLTSVEAYVKVEELLGESAILLEDLAREDIEEVISQIYSQIFKPELDSASLKLSLTEVEDLNRVDKINALVEAIISLSICSGIFRTYLITSPEADSEVYVKALHEYIEEEMQEEDTQGFEEDPPSDC